MTRAVEVAGVDISDFVTEWPSRCVEESDGKVPELVFGVRGTHFQAGTGLRNLTDILPGNVDVGQSLLFRDGSNVFYAGKINLCEDDPDVPGNYSSTITGTTYQEELNTPVPYLSFSTGTIVYAGETFDLSRDTHRVRYLFALYLPTWDHTTYIPDTAYATFNVASSYYKSTVGRVLQDIAAWLGPNPDTPLVGRSWFVSASWNAGITTKYISYFSRALGGGASSQNLTSGQATSGAVSIQKGTKRRRDRQRLLNGLVVGGPGGDLTDVSWQSGSTVNVDAQGNTLTKNGGSGSAWDAGAFGDQSITTEGGYVTAQLALKNAAVGWSTTNDSVSYDTIRFGIRTQYTSGTTGTLDLLYYNGTPLVTNIGTYTAGSTVKVEIVRNMDAAGAFWQGFVYLDQGTGYVLLYGLRFTYAQIDDGTHGGTNRFPMYVDTSLYSTAATLTAVTARRHAFSTFQRADSVTAYGVLWAEDVLMDDRLDTVEARQRKAEQIFDRRAYPRVTLLVDTVGKKQDGSRFQFHSGTTVQVTMPKFGYTNQVFLIARVTTDWAASDNPDWPMQHLELGDRLLEGGEDDTGYLLRIPTRDTENPPIPSGLTVAAYGFDSGGSVWAKFTWTQTTRDEEWVYVRALLQGPNPPRRPPVGEYAATRNYGFMENLQPGKQYRFEIAAEDYNGNRSAFGNSYLWTAPIVPPSPMLYNGDFEIETYTGSGKPDGWIDTVTGSSLVLRILYSGAGEKPYKGRAYLDMLRKVNTETCIEESLLMLAEPNAQYTLWVAWDQDRSSAATYVSVRWWDASQVLISESNWLNGHNGYFGAMHFDGTTMASPAGTAFATVYLKNISTVNDTHVYFDNIILAKSIGSLDITNYSIGNQQINDNQIDNRVMADNAINTAELAAGAVTNAKLAVITDSTKFTLDIETNPLQFYNAGAAAYRGQLNYDHVADIMFLSAANPSGTTELQLKNTAQNIRLNSTNIIYDTGGSAPHLFKQGSLVSHEAALSTTATDGFFYITTCSGPPTGVPTTQTGCKAAVFDIVNNQLYIYNGAWKKVALT